MSSLHSQCLPQDNHAVRPRTGPKRGTKTPSPSAPRATNFMLFRTGPWRVFSPASEEFARLYHPPFRLIARSRARKQVECVSRGRWRKAKTWDAAILLWNESCDAFHDDGCPSPKPSPPPKLNPSPKPNLSPQSEPTSRPTTFYMEDQHSRSTACPISAFEAGLRMGLSSSAPVSSAPLPGPSTPPRSRPHRRSQPAAQFSASTPKRQTPREPPHSPLAMMDAVEAFSRMGVDNPSAETLPAKQWAIAGVNKFFAAR